MAEGLFAAFDRIVVFDTETTGIDFQRDVIIELGAVSLTREGEQDSLDLLVQLPAGQRLPPEIVALTHITDALLHTQGVDRAGACQAFCRFMAGGGRTLMAAYNAQFDLNFLYHFLRPYGRVDVLVEPRFLDLLTVYRDRRDYPHKLCNAIEAYGITGEQNSHRAVDDARATVALMRAMAEERDDLLQYLDLFGTHPKYGVSGRRIGSVTYRPQSYRRTVPLYQKR